MIKHIYIQKFKDLYEKKNGKTLSDFEAMDQFEKLIVLVKAVYQPMPKKHCNAKNI